MLNGKTFLNILPSKLPVFNYHPLSDVSHWNNRCKILGYGQRVAKTTARRMVGWGGGLAGGG